MTSDTSNSSPKSQKIEPKRPKVSVMMKRVPEERHASLMAIACARHAQGHATSETHSPPTTRPCI